MGIENSILSAQEAQSIFPLLNPKSFVGALYSPGDGDIDPSQLCNALVKLAIATTNAEVIEDCPVREIHTVKTERGQNKIVALQTDFGVIKTDCIVNAAGVWGNRLTESLGCTIPIVAMKHAYIVTEAIDGVQRMPNLRDHDASIYFRKYSRQADVVSVPTALDEWKLEIYSNCGNCIVFKAFVVQLLKWAATNRIQSFWIMLRTISISDCTIWIGRHLISM